jgi:hypothetical protein
MAKPATTDKPKRTRQPKYFIARLTGVEDDILVVAKTQESAFDALVQLRPATPKDILQAGRDELKIIDITTLGAAA